MIRVVTVSASQRPSRSRMRSITRVSASLAAAAALLAAAGCSDDNGGKLPAPAVTLPAGSLEHYVPQPEEVPQGMVPLIQQTGEADIEKLAGFSSDPATARTALAQHGFENGYVVEYADTATGRVITVVVSKFASIQGATADITADLSAVPPAGAQTVIIPAVGDQSGAVKQALPNAPAGSELVTVRFRVGAMTWLVAVGAHGAVDPSAVTSIASNLAARVPGIASASPAAS